MRLAALTAIASYAVHIAALASKQITQHVLQAAAAGTLSAASCGPAAAQDVAQHILQTAAAGAATWGATRLSAAKNVAQDVIEPAAGLARRRCCGAIVVSLLVLLPIAAARGRLRFVRPLLRRQGVISALGTGLAAELAEEIAEGISPPCCGPEGEGWPPPRTKMSRMLLASNIFGILQNAGLPPQAH